MIDVIARGMIEESNGDISQISEKVNNHTEDSDIHVTTTDKENWNSHPNDVLAEGNPIQMDGLQGGVPFSEMVVSGKNLIGIAQAKGLTGDNTNGFFVFDNSASRSIIQKLQPNTTYHIKKYDSGNRFRIVMFDDEPANTADVNAQQLIYNTDGSISDYTLSTGENHLWMVLATHYATSGDAIEPVVQLEFGTEATAYKPPITGRELTVGVSGKNLFGDVMNYYLSGNQQNGFAFAPSAGNSFCFLGIIKNNTDYTVTNYSDGNRFKIVLFKNYPDNAAPEECLDILPTESNTVTFNSEEYNYCVLSVAYNYANITIKKAQLEIGTVATAYEPYHGSVTTIMPDSNPYIIPNDIRQVDGLNVVSVSEGELSVSGVRKNAAIKRIWDDMNMDLLFDGLALVASPAEIDLGNYSKYLINCYDNVDSAVQDCCASIVVEYDRLKHIVDIAGMFVHSLYTSYTLEFHFSGTMDNANYYAKQSNKETAAYYTRIYGIK